MALVALGLVLAGASVAALREHVHGGETRRGIWFGMLERTISRSQRFAQRRNFGVALREVRA